MRATWTSQRMESSRAFFIKPFRLFEKVTWRLLLSSIRFSSTFLRPIQSPNCSLSSVICFCSLYIALIALFVPLFVSVSVTKEDSGSERIYFYIIYNQREGKRWDGQIGAWWKNQDDFHLTRVPSACLISFRQLLYADSLFLFSIFRSTAFRLEEEKFLS